jgi:hypothetical protein
VRVPDVAAFLRRIAPALERRLAGSFAAGYTGELPISFYRGGVKLGFESGRLAAVEPLAPPDEGRAETAFPGLTFLQLLLGFRSFAELSYAFPDCQAESPTLLDALFPKRGSFFSSIE